MLRPAPRHHHHKNAARIAFTMLRERLRFGIEVATPFTVVATGWGWRFGGGPIAALALLLGAIVAAVVAWTMNDDDMAWVENAAAEVRDYEAELREIREHRDPKRLAQLAGYTTAEPAIDATDLRFERGRRLKGVHVAGMRFEVR
jgi:hypothetical protein